MKSSSPNLLQVFYSFFKSFPLIEFHTLLHFIVPNSFIVGIVQNQEVVKKVFDSFFFIM
jgi:hypothetical protein